MPAPEIVAPAVVPGPRRSDDPPAPLALDDASARLALALAQLRAGRVREVTTSLLALRAGADSLPALDRVRLLAALVECRLARGDLTAALTHGDDLVGELGGPGLAAALAHVAHGDLAAASGEAESALEHYLTAGAIVGPTHLADAPWGSGAALTMVRLGRRREAAELGAEQLEIARADGSPYVVAAALRTLAGVDGSGRRETLLAEARELAGLADAGRLRAQVDTDLAGLLLLAGTPEGAAQALPMLREAEDFAGRQELWPLQARVRRLLERLGEEPRKVQSEAMASLTAAERRVARLAADGLTNRQIATELVVTVKAVEWHLSHIYRKLGIRSRTRLAATLGPAA